MTDIYRIKSICADFEVFLRGKKPMADGAPPLESLESLRTRYWYESLRQRFAFTGPAQMERHLEPGAVVLDEDGRKKHSSNKWGRYRDGGRLRQATLMKVEKNAPGSMRIYHHPIWDVLNLENEIVNEEAFLQSLPAQVQVILFQQKAMGVNGYVERVPVNRFLLRKLELRAGLDVLACLAWLLREAAINERNSVSDIRRSLHNVLLMTAIEFQAMGVALPLLQYFVGRIMPIGLQRYHQLAITPFQYVEFSCALNEHVFSIVADGKSLLWEERVSVMCRLLRGEFGLDIPLAMALPEEANSKLGWIPPRVIRQLKTFAWSRSYGARRLFCGG